MDNAPLPPIKSREEIIMEKIDDKYGVDYDIKKSDDEIIKPFRMMTSFYEDILQQIKTLKCGENIRIKIKKSPIKLGSIRLNICAIIKRKLPNYSEYFIVRRKNDLFVGRLKE